MEKILATKVAYNPNDVVKKYRSLKRIINQIDFDLFYYPYWWAEIFAKADFKWLPGRTLQSQSVVDGVSGEVLKVISRPNLSTVSLGKHDFSVCSAEIMQEQAGNLALSDAMKKWQKKLQRPFSPKVYLEKQKVKVEKLHKPFWVISQKDSSQNNYMLVDASTGIAASHEMRSVLLAFKKAKAYKPN